MLANYYISRHARTTVGLWTSKKNHWQQTLHWPYTDLLLHDLCFLSIFVICITIDLVYISATLLIITLLCIMVRYYVYTMYMSLCPFLTFSLYCCFFYYYYCLLQYYCPLAALMKKILILILKNSRMFLKLIIIIKYFSFLLICHHFQMSASFDLLLKRCFHDHASHTDRHRARLSSGRGVRWRRDEQRHIHADDVTGSGDCGFKCWFCSILTGERFEFPLGVIVGKAVLRSQMKLLPPSPTICTTEVTWFTELLSHWQYLLLYIFCSMRGQFKAKLLYFDLPASWLLH